MPVPCHGLRFASLLHQEPGNDYHPVVNSSIRTEASPMTSSHHASASPSAGIWTGTRTDFRHAVRLLWKDKRITATTLVTLALCIGATTAIFSSVYALMLKPLPYQEAGGVGGVDLVAG